MGMNFDMIPLILWKDHEHFKTSECQMTKTCQKVALQKLHLLNTRIESSKWGLPEFCYFALKGYPRVPQWPWFYRYLWFFDVFGRFLPFSEFIDYWSWCLGSFFDFLEVPQGGDDDRQFMHYKIRVAWVPPSRSRGIDNMSEYHRTTQDYNILQSFAIKKNLIKID